MPRKPAPIARRTHVVRSDELDNRDWLRDQPVCRELRQHHIGHVEILVASEPFSLERTDQSGTCMMACFGGSGMVMLGGQWKRIATGQGCLLPPFVTNSLKAVGVKPMKMCTVRYHESREAQPIISHKTPILGPYDPDPLLRAIQGLHAEAAGPSVPAQLHAWSELIHGYVLRFAQPHQSDSRLWQMWESVGRELTYQWTLDDLAAKACVSKEQLRRLCWSEFDRSPMQHVTFLRIQRARHLLATTDAKVQSISNQVGFTSPNTFSNTFQKWTGHRPSEAR